MNGQSRFPTPYMVYCTEGHGEVYLTETEYHRQMMNPNDLWRCPVCNAIAHWDDANYEKWLSGDDDHPSAKENENGH